MHNIPLLDEDIAQLVQLGVSIKVTGGDDDLATACLALGCRVSDDRSQMTILLSADCSPARLVKLRSEGTISIAVITTSPSQVFQIKGRDVKFAILLPDDHALIAQHRQAFNAEIAAMGYRESLAYSFAPEFYSDLVAISFTPTAVAKLETSTLAQSRLVEQA